jgi:hypothetical protein
MSASEDPATGEFLDRIQRVTLPEPVGSLATEYATLFGDRDRFLWQWIYSLFPAFTLSSVPPEHAQQVRTQKTVLTMYVTVLDDLVEHREDLRTFEEARRFAYAPETVDGDDVAVDDDQFAFIERLWETFEEGARRAPRYDEFADVFAYDIRQTTNAMHYSAVVNGHPRIANLDGARRYDAHNMAMFPYADVDLMYSPGFALADFGAVRDLLWDLQELARIGNWLTTWERELREGDYTSGIVVTALQDGVIEPADLHGPVEDAVSAIRDHGIEARFRARWEEQYGELRTREFDTESVDLGAMVDGMETVFEYHRASRGHK